MNTSDGREYYGFGIDNSQLRREAQQAIDIFDGIGSTAEAEGARIDTAFRRAGQAVVAYFSAQQLYSFASSVIKTRGEIEALEISFETLLGNKDKAKEFFGEIKDFAVNTPMQLGDLAKGAQTLLGFKVEAEKVMPILRQIGDISMGSSEKFNSLVLAFSQMSSTGKLMGQDLLQMINAGFNPLVEMSKITGKSISELKDDMSAGAISADMVAEAFAHAAGEGGTFNGMLEKQSKGLQGAISNLQGAWDDMLNDIGSKQQGVFVDGISLATEAIKHYELFANALLAIAAAYGTYKAILAAVVVIQKAQALADNIRLVMMFRKELGLLTAAQQAFNITAWANPYVLLAAAIVGVATALYLYADTASNAEKAQEKLNEQKDEFQKKLDEEAQKVNELISIIQDKTETDYAQLKAYEELKKVCPAITDAYTQEKLAALELTEVRKALNEEMERKTYENAQQNLQRYTWLLSEASQAEGNWTKMSKEAQDAIRNELGTGLLKNKVEQLKDVVKGYQEQVDEIERVKKEAEEKAKPIETKIVEAKADLEQIQKEFDKAKAKLEEEQAKTKKQFGKQVMTFFYEIKFRMAQGNLKKAQDKVANLEAEKAAQTTYEQDYNAAAKAWKQAKKKLDTIKRDKAKYTQKQYKDAADAEEKARKAYKNLGGEITTTKQDKSAADKAKRDREEYAKKMANFKRLTASQAVEQARAEKDAQYAVEQARIDAMQDGSEKILAQMALDHKRELEMLDREKADYLQRKVDNARALFEANPANKGKVFNGSNITLTPEENASFAQRKKYTEQKQANEGQELVERQRTTMNEYLKEFGDYMEKRQAIIDLYNAQMAKATTEGERLSLSATMKRELSELDIEAKKSTAAISRLFEDMTDKTVKNMRDIADAGEQALQFLIAGEWDDAKGIEFGMSQETFDTLRKSPAELEKIRKEIKQIREEADKSDTAFNKMANGLKKVFAAGNDTKKLKDGLGMIEDGLNDVMNVSGFLQNSLSDLGDALGSDALKGAADGISAAMDVANATMSGAQAGAMFGPWGAAAGAAIGLVSSLGSAIAKLHDAKHEKKIKKLQEQIEVLEKSYDKLGRSVEKAYSKDASKMIEQQNTLLEQQKVLIRNQIAEEKSKKKTDWDRIKEWENQIEEIDQLIADNKEKAVDAIFGEDLKSAIDNFSSAYAEAWASGGDKAKSAKDVVRKMMQQMVTESIKAAIQSSKSMEQIRQKLQEFYADNVLSPWEQDYIYRMAENLQKELDDQFGWADSLMYEGSSASQDSTKRGFATASQDSIDELNGRFTAIQLNSEANKITLITISDDVKIIRLQVIANRENMEEIRNLALLAVGHLETIAKNTKQLFEMNERLGKIEKNTRKL